MSKKTNEEQLQEFDKIENNVFSEINPFLYSLNSTAFVGIVIDTTGTLNYSAMRYDNGNPQNEIPFPQWGLLFGSLWIGFAIIASCKIFVGYFEKVNGLTKYDKEGKRK